LSPVPVTGNLLSLCIGYCRPRAWWDYDRSSSTQRVFKHGGYVGNFQSWVHSPWLAFKRGGTPGPVRIPKYWFQKPKTHTGGILFLGLENPWMPHNKENPRTIPLCQSHGTLGPGSYVIYKLGFCPESKKARKKEMGEQPGIRFQRIDRFFRNKEIKRKFMTRRQRIRRGDTAVGWLWLAGSIKL